MGSAWSLSPEAKDLKVKAKLDTLMRNLQAVLKTLRPEEILMFALEDKEVYKICQNDADLRQRSILAAIRRHHRETYRYEDPEIKVSSSYRLLLEHFIQIQNEYERLPSVSPDLQDQRCSQNQETGEEETDSDEEQPGAVEVVVDVQVHRCKE